MASAIPKDIKASLYIDGKPAEASLKNVEQVTRTLERELKGLTIGTEAWNAKMKEVANNKKYLKEVKDEINGVGGAFNKLKQELGSLGTLAAGYLGFQFVSDQFSQMIVGNAKVSDSLADMRRVIGLNEEEVRALDKSLKDLDTRTSRGGLRDIAIIAGKLGVAKNDIIEFTKATDMLVVALGDELGDADTITTQLGKILNVFDGKVTGENITTLGNAMVKLANDGVASAGFVADFTQRVSGIAKTANLSLGATVGLAAGLEELGARSESAGTAMQKLLTDIAGDLPKAASYAKMEVSEFSKLFAQAPQEALIKYAEGLTKNKAAFSEVSQALSGAGEEGARTVDVLTKLGQKGDFLRAKIETGTQALKDNTEITEAFRLKNETLGSTLDKISKWFAGIATSPVVTGALTSLANGFANLVGITRKHSEELEKERTAINKLEFQIISVNTKTEDRIRLINELKSKYPSLLSNLNAEKATNLDIAKAIKLVNDQLVNKIILAKQDEKIEEENKSRAEIRMQRLALEDKIRDKLVKVSKAFPEFKLIKDGTLTEAEMLQDLLDKIIAKRNKLGQTSGGIFDKTYGAGSLLYQYNRVNQAEKGSEKESAFLAKQREDLKKRLGIKDDIVIEDTVVPTVFTPSGAPLDPKAESEAEKKLKKAIEDAEKLRDELDKINDQIYKNSLSKYDQEVFAISSKYEDLRKKAVGNKEDLAEIDRLEGLEVVALQKKIKEDSVKEAEEAAKKLKEINWQIFEATATTTDLEIAQAVRKYDELIELAKANGLATIELEKAKQAAINRINDKAAGKKSPEEELEDKKKKKQEEIDFYFDQAQGLSNAIFEIGANNRRNETEAKLKTLEEQKNAELSNKDLTDQQRTEIEERYAAKVREEKLRAWKADQKAAIAQVVINGAVAVTKALAQVGPLGAFVIPSIIAGTVLQSGVILAQKPPEFAEGGMSNEDPSGYVSKATIFNKSASGRPFVAGEKGKEWIAPNWMLNNPRTANIIGTLEMARKEKRMFATGGFNDVGGGAPNQMMYNFERLEAMITSSIAEQRRFNSLPIVNVYADKEEYERKLQRDRSQQTA